MPTSNIFSLMLQYGAAASGNSRNIIETSASNLDQRSVLILEVSVWGRNRHPCQP
jgi:hypothetical protein